MSAVTHLFHPDMLLPLPLLLLESGELISVDTLESRARDLLCLSERPVVQVGQELLVGVIHEARGGGLSDMQVVVGRLLHESLGPEARPLDLHARNALAVVGRVDLQVVDHVESQFLGLGFRLEYEMQSTLTILFLAI